ncbi:hypothetical protein R1flu_010712 [Riccia fluitans]|uniref:Uncharacterized protein n=1 Tax=Riccia fluitans TaxID=41844 RepID=A0ABD1Z5R9_9MARC
MSDLPPEIFLDDDNMDSEAGVIPSTLDINFESRKATCEERKRVMASKMMETRYKIDNDDKWTGVGNFAKWSYQMWDKLTTQGQARS